MNRRQFLTGAAGVSITAGGAWIATNGLPTDDALPVQIETIAATGSSAGQRQVPGSEAVTMIDLFATWCAPCKKQMETLSALHGEFGDRVTFVSVTNERIGDTLTRDDLRAWWSEHDGAWTLGYDPESQLMQALGAGGLPYLALVAADGTVTWRDGGLTSEATLQSEIETALER